VYGWYKSNYYYTPTPLHPVFRYLSVIIIIIITGSGNRAVGNDLLGHARNFPNETAVDPERFRENAMDPYRVLAKGSP